MSEQDYVGAPPYSQSQPRMGGFSKSFGPPNSSLCYGHYDNPNSSYAAPQPGMSKSTVPLESSVPVGPPPPGTHEFSQTNFQNGPNAAAQPAHRSWHYSELSHIFRASSIFSGSTANTSDTAANGFATWFLHQQIISVALVINLPCLLWPDKMGSLDLAPRILTCNSFQDSLQGLDIILSK